MKFYAFCRVIDDLADSHELTIEEKQTGFARWKDGLANGFKQADAVEQAVIELQADYDIPTELFLEIIAGCESDLQPQRFETWDDLSQYTYKVACAVGLISIRIFGCVHEQSEKYAIALGHALQLTNILRDVGEDLENEDRIYLPLAELEAFGYTEQDLRNRIYDHRFVAAMDHLAERAEGFYRESLDSMHPVDHKALKSAEAMSGIYHAILEKMRDDKFRVFEKRYKLSKLRKILILIASMMTHSNQYR